VQLGTFALSSDIKRATSAAGFTAALAFCAIAGAAFGTRHFIVALAAPFVAVFAFLIDKKRRVDGVPRGSIDLEDGVLSFRRKEQTIHRVKLSEATVSARAIKLGNQRMRTQIAIAFGDRAIVGKLEVPFQAAETDEEGLLPSTIELDRQGSRAFDALSYGKLK
jgi:hypothetical protein